MILGALADYYDRRRRQAKGAVEVPPPFGYSSERVSFALVLSEDGSLREPLDLRTHDGKGRPHPVAEEVPRPLGGRTSGIRAYFLCDKTQYLLGAGGNKPERDREAFEVSRAKHLDYLAGSKDAGAVALRRFFERWDPAEAETLPLWPEMAGATLVFKLADTPGYLHQRPALQEIWQARFADENESVERQCLVTGESAPVAVLHPAVKGVRGAQTSGAYLVSFNAEAFCSYGHGVEGKGLNAPVSERAAFAYATALNELLRWNSPQKLQLGETSVVLWAATDTPYEAVLPALFGGGDASGLDVGTRDRLKRVLEVIGRGQRPSDTLDDLEPGVFFYVLGLAAPSQARLTVRFWLVSTLGQLLDGVAQHHADLAIERRHPDEPQTPPLWRLVAETAQDYGLGNALPSLHAGLLHAILTGGPYPWALLGQVLGRIRAEVGQAGRRSGDDPVNHPRAALIKAVLVRQARTQGRHVAKEIDAMSLDTETADVPYRLGRLFAVMEKAQRDALGQNLNRTIRDGYFATASAAPRAVFPRLLRLTQHHISKAEYGGASDRRIAEIVEELTPNGAFPAQFDMEQQGRFVLGYYHQRNALYRKREDAAPPPPDTGDGAAATTSPTAEQGEPA